MLGWEGAVKRRKLRLIDVGCGGKVNGIDEGKSFDELLNFESFQYQNLSVRIPIKFRSSLAFSPLC